jgi:hypothetical protein
MFPPRFRFPLSNLAAFALGAGLTAAWFQRGDSAPPVEPAMPRKTQSDGEIARNGTGPMPKPWKTKSSSAGARSAEEGIRAPLPEVVEKIRREFRAQSRHAARIRAHEISVRLGLDPDQTEQFLAATLQDAETRVRPSDEDRMLSFSHEFRGHAWLKANLTDQQKHAYEAYQRDLQREEADRHALTEANGIARMVELTEEQRAALLRKFAESHIPMEFVDFSDFLTYGEPIAAEATDSAGAPTNVVITESRIEMPVFTGRQPWLSEILTEDQLATYREFQEKQRELERLKEEEMRGMESQ